MRIQKIWGSKFSCFMLPSDKDIALAKWLETKGIFDTGLIKSLASLETVQEYLEDEYCSGCGSLPWVITRAASLAHHGLLGSVPDLSLCDEYPTSLPAEHLASLVSSVTEWVSIENVSGCGLVTILDSVKSKCLSICRQSLGSEETQALVRAMESGVEEVELDYWIDGVTLEIRDLMEYSGQGKCRTVSWCWLEKKGILDTGAIESLVERVKECLKDFPSSLPVITCAASLAHQGLLGSVQEMRLWNVDLTSLPAEHLASLVSSVTRRIIIENVSGCDLVTILDSVKSEKLSISSQSLDSEETQALVRAMESGVEWVWLYREVTLDIRDLMEYSGQGKCRKVRCDRDTAGRYREQLRTWATSRNWEVTYDNNDTAFVIKKI